MTRTRRSSSREQAHRGGSPRLAVAPPARPLPAPCKCFVAAQKEPFWVGIDDKANQGTFVTQKNAPATFLPWAANQPDQSAPPKSCANAIFATEIGTDKCGTPHTAVCECEP